MRLSKQLAIVATVASLVVAQDFDDFWKPSETILNYWLPLLIEDKNYDDLVVDPMTNDIYPGQPWLLFFYIKRCSWCQEFKSEFEDLANRLHDVANFGMIDCHKSEYLKESYRISAYPTLILIYDGMAYEYEGSRTFESIRAFIKQDHIYIKNQFEIPPHMGEIGLRLRYLERDMPKIEAFLDLHIFEKLGQHENLTREAKLGIVVGAVLLVVLTLLITLCCCCCGKKKRNTAVAAEGEKDQGTKKPTSRSAREKID
ncbi:protein disulfide isomerase family member 4 [Stylonychia lemnae]|uniref:Protein disulfide isomerase family member 4 n=1 Tax=Stylonychia lemnae TaxID=5949 RepID=A0A077ZWY8_STYLE|nr:protein disulfide isomerase family member 4 [Stylonychia lemnae]|eukprot:CDW74375.1 protein disulfide isomerase family member 4 [Stylonychia lemnae]